MLGDPVRILPDPFGEAFRAHVLRGLFDRRELWEKRLIRAQPYQNGDWFTLGSSLYLDLPSAEAFPQYQAKCAYFNDILQKIIPEEFMRKFTMNLGITLGSRVDLLAHSFFPAGAPGFHIFPGREAFCVRFGKAHQDMQWQQLAEIPGFQFKDQMTNHFSVTVPLMLPYSGGGLLWGEKLGNYLRYEVGKIYLQTMPIIHAIAPYEYPVLPNDYRITLQCHGFKVHNMAYLYW